jgi:AcrR family transcriptional regulator
MEETRERIVEGALALHLEKGIAATSIKDVAARAQVGIGTVYFHFPIYENLVRACAGRVTTITRPPTPEVFEGLETVDARITRLVDELFAFYERYHWFDRLRCERDKLAFVGEAVARRERAIEDLVREALRPLSPQEPVVRTVVALTDFGVYKSLTLGGLPGPAGAHLLASVLKAWLRTLDAAATT